MAPRYYILGDAVGEVHPITADECRNAARRCRSKLVNTIEPELRRELVLPEEGDGRRPADRHVRRHALQPCRRFNGVMRP
jgi:hypothetical protein